MVFVPSGDAHGTAVICLYSSPAIFHPSPSHIHILSRAFFKSQLSHPALCFLSTQQPCHSLECSRAERQRQGQ